MPDLSYRQKHRSRQRLTGRVAVGYDRMTHGWLDHWLSNGDTYCKRAAWAWEIEQAAWRPGTISLRGVAPSLERGQLCHPLLLLRRELGLDHWREQAMKAVHPSAAELRRGEGELSNRFSFAVVALGASSAHR